MKLKTKGVTAWSGTGDSLPPGSYVVKVVQAEEAESRNGNPQIVVDLQVCEGDFSGAEIRDWITVTEVSMGRVVQVLQALGFDTDKDVDLQVAEMVGKRAEVVVREESYTNRDGDLKTSMKVKGYRAVAENRESDVDNDVSAFKSNGDGTTKADDAKIPF